MGYFEKENCSMCAWLSWDTRHSVFGLTSQPVWISSTPTSSVGFWPNELAPYEWTATRARWCGMSRRCSSIQTDRRFGFWIRLLRSQPMPQSKYAINVKHKAMNTEETDLSHSLFSAVTTCHLINLSAICSTRGSLLRWEDSLGETSSLKSK
jgi:hypothetical protein